MSNDTERRLTPLRAIRVWCLDCSHWQPKEIRQCPSTKCPLYPYRFGKNPNRVGAGRKRGVSTQKTPSQQAILEEKDKE